MNEHEAALAGVTPEEASELARARGQDQTPQVAPDPATVPPGRPLPAYADDHVPGLSDKKWTSPEADESAPEAERPAPTPGQAPEQQQGVPPAALAEERGKRRDAEKELADTRAQQQILAERMALIQQDIEGAQAARLATAKAAQAPNPDDDILGYIKHQETEWQGRFDDQQRQINQQNQQQTEQAQVQNVRDRAAADAQAIAHDRPDFRQAYDWMRDKQIRELTAQGIVPQVASAVVDRNELQLFAAHQQQGRNSAESYYAAALERGWQTPQGNGQQVQPPASNYTPEPQNAIQNPPGRAMLPNMQAGMLESRNVGQAAGGGTAMPMDLTAYGNMTDAQFAEHRIAVKAMMRSQMG